MATFTALRESIAQQAERALSIATETAGCAVQWRAIAASWHEATGEPCPYDRVQPWWWIFEPGLLAGRVVKEKRGARVYYRPADGASLPVPAPARFNEFRERICALAESALRAALDAAGTQVTRIEVKKFWPEGEIPAPADRSQDWTRAFAPAVESGRVVATKQGTAIFYRFGIGMLALPERPSRPRVTGSDVALRLHRVSRALERAVSAAGAMVRANAVRAFWSDAEGDAPSFDIVRLDLALLETEGSVRAVRSGRHAYYAPALLPDLRPSAFDSDLRRVEEAVARATKHWSSAVPVGEVEREVDRDPLLHLQGAAPVSTLLKSLREHSRVRTATRHNPGAREYKYYAPPDGPHWVRGEVELAMDRRRRAVRDLWRRCGGRPFTTRCVRLFAKTRAGYRLDGFPPYAWTNALHVMHRDNFLVRLESEDGWHCRWAIVSDWNALGTAEREKLMVDVCGRDPNNVTFARPAEDPSMISRREDMRALVLAAKTGRRTEESDAEVARIVAARPVALRELRESRHLRPHLRLTRRGKFGTALVTEAVRAEFRRKRKPVARIGVVGRERFIDTEHTPGNAAYLRYANALHAVQVGRHQSALRRWAEARELAMCGRVPIPSVVLNARASSSAAAARARATELRAACLSPDVLLFDEERSEALAIAVQLDAIAEQFGCSADPIPDVGPGLEWGRLVAIDDAIAWEQLREHLAWKVRHPGSLAIRSTMMRTVDAALLADPNPTRVRQRAAKHYLERVDFALYASWRCGGASLSAAARRAMHIAGLLRDPRPFACALEQESEAPAHDGMATVLGFFDEPGARRSLVRYIHGYFDNRAGTILGVEAAVYALARSPFGGCTTRLEPDERDALVRTQMDAMDARARWTASRVLTSWDQQWDQQQLLWL